MTTNRRSEFIAADRPMTRRGVFGLAASTISVGALVSACGEEDSADEVEAEQPGEAGGRAMGVDVSKFQGSIDWNSVAAAGHQFAMVKATEGASIVDPQFAANWSGSQAAGLRRGAYHFFDPEESGEAQAEHFLSTVGPDLGELPPAIDLETGVPGRTDVQLWLDEVEVMAGVRPMIYTTVEFAEEHLDGFGSYPLWIAAWGESSPTLPAGWSTWTMWQHTPTGRVSGIDGDVDLNFYAGPLPPR